MTSAGPVTDFLTGQGRDGAGRTADQVLAFDDGRLEARHDFIQWLFPLTEPSAAVPGSPVLTLADVAAIRADPRAQATLTAAASRMRAFYEGSDHWLRPSDHNHLRITRIIRSLRLLVDDAAADAFRAAVLARADGTPVGPTSRAYWASA